MARRKENAAVLCTQKTPPSQPIRMRENHEDGEEVEGDRLAGFIAAERAHRELLRDSQPKWVSDEITADGAAPFFEFIVP